ncbi:tannase/feruloyl esterase family alpha/beta hydrolase [Sphingomonas asaccharolytica]|uniref:tannase/feruloyl esterase family alpha/beta hydrolase n=1 Tax=Sphingomonas asaccharolytica TaxID=40681 RepID=UPI00082985E6|nr:tannase/feruloyl esterase family alpha/beta hydrolase [Sphingomonas asaccharolytica]
MVARRTLQRMAAALSASAATVALAPAAQAAPDACAALKKLAIPHVRILVATPVDGTFTEDMVVERGPRTYTGLKPFCRVRGVSSPVRGSEIGFEIWLPAKRDWSGRLHMIGNGAYVSNMQYKQMIPRLDDGDVAVGTDTGHVGTDLKFGWKNPEKIKDFGYRAVHESVVAAKAITRAYYSRPARWSYFSGCSTGGYQGLASAQRYPKDFDGIIAGAPGNNRTSLTMAFLWNYFANHRPGDDRHPILSVSDLVLINRATVAACDKLDGVEDGVIADPRQCGFKPSRLLCRPGAQAGTCLSQEQVAAADKIYVGPRDARTGKAIYPGYPVGTEGVMSGRGDKHPGWSGYWSESDNPAEPSRADMFKYWVFDNPDWNWWSFNWGSDVDTMRARLGPIFDANNANLSPFARAGGKLIIFMGWQDPVGTPLEAINYYRAVEARAGGLAAAQAFARLFMVPGMDHCAGGPGATNFSTATRDSTPPVRDAEHDMTLALYAWVEKARAPQSLIATRYASGGEDTPPAKRAIAFQRPICAWPKAPVYRGGDAKLATSFVCAVPKNP